METPKTGKSYRIETEWNPIDQNKYFGEEFFKSNYKTIYNFAYKMTGNEEDAEDIVQEVFYCALQNIQSFRGESKISTWLYAITKNAFLKHRKKSPKNSFTALENLIQTGRQSTDANEFADIERKYYIAQVKEGCLLALIRCLNFNQRIAFILNVLFDVEITDVALILNKTENATRILIHRAKQNIKEFLCKNCSLYHSTNLCHCESLIHFSLNNQWIERYSNSSKRKNLSSEEVENDLKEFKRIIFLYHSLPECYPSEDFVQRIQSEIRTEKYEIFF